MEKKGDMNVVGKMGKFQVSFWEVGVFTTVVFAFLSGLLCVYLTMPASDYSFLKLPRNLQDLQILRYCCHVQDRFFVFVFSFVVMGF